MTESIRYLEGHRDGGARGRRKKAPAFAVIVDDEIDVRTVSDTRRDAIVNWLVVERSILVMNSTTDEQIEQLWGEHRGKATVEPVEIGRVLRTNGEG